MVSVLGISMFGFSGFCVSVLMRRLVLTLGFSVLYIPVCFRYLPEDVSNCFDLFLYRFNQWDLFYPACIALCFVL